MCYQQQHNRVKQEQEMINSMRFHDAEFVEEPIEHSPASAKDIHPVTMDPLDEE